MVRRAQPEDLPFILAAQEACRFELDSMDPETVLDGIKRGQLEAYVLVNEAGEPRMMVAASVEAPDAMLSCVYRVAPTDGLKGDAEELFDVLRRQLHIRGVKRMYGCVSLHNPLYGKLLRFYGRMGFLRDMTRITCEV